LYVLLHEAAVARRGREALLHADLSFLTRQA
jgi:hypothetical protein